MTLRVALHGASGKMGRAITSAIEADSQFSLALSLGRSASFASASFAEVDVLIDFSSTAAIEAVVGVARAHRLPLVVGTTGLNAEHKAMLSELSRDVPVLVAPNTSVGVTVLAYLARKAASLLGDSYDAEIVEMHHRNKVDAPSGTALRLAESVAAARNTALSDVAAHARSGHVGPRKQGEIGILAMRGGDVIGDHTLVFAGAGERVELSHKATSRELFARGALRAAGFVAAAKPSLYRMEDVLGLTE